MHWRDWFAKRGVILSELQREALAAWSALPEPAPNEALSHVRWVVVDVEASGLDMRRDHLLSIGAVALHGFDLVLSDCFEVVLRQSKVSDDANILIHGIGGTAQRTGTNPADALLQFLQFLGKSPWVAYHAAFDQAMIGRAMRDYLGVRFTRPALDLAYLAPAVFSDSPARPQTLDNWLTRFGIRSFSRHHAVSDAFATAQLLQVTLHQASASDMRERAQLAQAEAAQLALSRMQSMTL